MENKNNGFFSFNIGHLLVIILNVVVLSFYFGKQETIAKREAEERTRLENRVERVNIQGGEFSKTLRAEVDSLDKRTELLENQVPQIITVMADLNNLKTVINEIKTDIKDIKKNQIEKLK